MSGVTLAQRLLAIASDVEHGAQEGPALQLRWLADALDPSEPEPRLRLDVDGPCRCSRTERVYCHADDCHGGEDVPPEAGR